MSCIHVMTHVMHPCHDARSTVSRPLCVYTCDYNMIVQIPRRPSVCVRAVCVCAVCVCFKSPLGGNSFFSSPSCLAVTWGRLMASLCGGC